MSTPQSWSSREEALLLLNAYLDNELDAASVLEIEQRMSADTSLRAEYDRLVGLRETLSTSRASMRASDALRNRIAAIADQPSTTSSVVPFTQPAKTQYAWRQMAAAAALAACVSGLAVHTANQQFAPSNELAAIVAGHQRALLAAEPFDVASSDRHTVTPWFDTKLAISPKVLDLADAGFPLVGGRVDVVEGKAVPTIVYKRHAHLISLTAVPKMGSRDDGRRASEITRDGYAIISWPGDDFEYSAVSDVAQLELNDFVTRWRTNAANEMRSGK